MITFRQAIRSTCSQCRIRTVPVQCTQPPFVPLSPSGPFGLWFAAGQSSPLFQFVDLSRSGPGFTFCAWLVAATLLCSTAHLVLYTEVRTVARAALQQYGGPTCVEPCRSCMADD